MRYKIAILVALIVGACVSSYAEEAEQKTKGLDEAEQKAKGLDMVPDTVTTVLNKATALLSGKLDITMSLDKPNTEEQFTLNAIGQKVPKSTAVSSAGSLHNDQPL